MIYCNLKGGLGNMMFQIAATTALAKNINTQASFPNLFKHLEYLNKETHHQPELNHAQKYLSFLNSLKTDSPKMNLPTIKYPFHYEEKSLPLHCWVDGFFQSEKYFSKHRKEILNIFSITEEIKLTLNKYSDFFNSKTASMHIRRGDYLKLSPFHPVLSRSYYKKAMQTIGEYDNLFIFSDDIEWCKNNFGEDEKYIFVNEKDYISIFLMSLCEHNIIANSSFSWWGAWLNKNKDKKVVCPSQWIGSALSNLDTKDVCCEDWIKI